MYQYVQLPKKNPCTKFQFPSLIFKVQRTLKSLLSGLGLLRMLEVPDWGLDFGKDLLYSVSQDESLYRISASFINS